MLQYQFNSSMLYKIQYILLLVVLTSVSCSDTHNLPDNLKKYTLVWEDEFNYSGKPDPLKWNYETGMIRNHEEQFYTDKSKNVRVEKGTLIIESIYEKILNPFYDPNSDHWPKNIEIAQYSSGSITTKGIVSWRYGKIEVKAKLPKGVGLWPAIWMLGDNINRVGWPDCGEIDIMEHVGFEKDLIFGTIHTGAYNHIDKTSKGKSEVIKDPYSKFHIYTVEWTPDKIDIFLDEHLYFSFRNENKTVKEWPFDQLFHLKINTAVGGGWGGQHGIDDSIFPQQFVIDYVRVYQK